MLCSKYKLCDFKVRSKRSTLLSYRVGKTVGALTNVDANQCNDLHYVH